MKTTPIGKLGAAIEKALDEAPVVDVLSILTGSFVSLTLELVRRQGHDVTKAVKIDGGSERDITIHEPKDLAAPPANEQAVPEIDYTALIHAAVAANKKWAQGTNGCVAFARGAEWFRQQALAMIAATLASPQDKQDTWLPIASAPRDGTNILLRFGKDGSSQGKYIPGIPYPWQFIDTANGISWLINQAVDGAGGPSHWMRIPD